MDPKHGDRLSTRIWYRSSARPCRFWFSSDTAPHLTIEALSDNGTAAYKALRRTLGKERWRAGVEGAALVDRRGDYVFVGRGADRAFLLRLSGFARHRQAEVPALANLVHAGAVDRPVDIKDEGALRDLEVGDLDVLRAPAIWDGVLVPDARSVARALHDRAPGQRLWFWLDPSAPVGEQPLLLEAVDDDPNRARIDLMIRALAGNAVEGAVTGIARVTDDGAVEFLSDRLDGWMLADLARWTVAHADAEPGLRALAGARFVRTDRGRIAEIHDDVSLWGELERPLVPATLPHTQAVLAGLAVGETAWFWGAGGPTPFLAALPVAEDPDAHTFRTWSADLGRRFPNSRGHALQGTVRRLEDGLLFVSESDRAAAFTHLTTSLRQTVPALGGARLLLTRDGAPLRAVAAT